VKKLLHVVKGRPDQGTQFQMFTLEGDPIRLREPPHVVIPRVIDSVNGFMPRDGEFFLVNAQDVETVLPILAGINPGCEVRVYAAEMIAQCPPQEMITKKISSHGVLPNI
jgi:hypothetical protein